MNTQQPQQNPVVVYPNTVTSQQLSQHHSHGSFSTVFIVLAVIFVVSVMACCFGRFCNRNNKNNNRHKHNQGHAQQKHKPPHESNNHHRDRETDPEFGFDNGVPSATRPYSNDGDARVGHNNDQKPPGRDARVGPKIIPRVRGETNVHFKAESETIGAVDHHGNVRDAPI